MTPGQAVARRPQEAALVEVATQLGIVRYSEGGAMLIDLGSQQLQEKYNVLAPATTLARADANFTPALHVITLDPADSFGIDWEGSGDNRKATSLAPSKVQLDQIAKVAGIEDVHSGVEYFGVSKENLKVTFTARMRRPDGTWQQAQGSREWIEADEREKLLASVPEWVTKAGPADKTNAKFNDWWAKNWLDRVKKHRLGMTETKARLRAYRQLLTIKAKYKKEEMAKPFLIASTMFTPDTSDLRVLGMVMSQGQQAQRLLYGAAATPESPVIDVDPETGELIGSGSCTTDEEQKSEPTAPEGERPTEDVQIPRGPMAGKMLSEVCEKHPDWAKQHLWKTEKLGLLTEDWLRCFHGDKIVDDDYSDITFGAES